MGLLSPDPSGEQNPESILPPNHPPCKGLFNIPHAALDPRSVRRRYPAVDDKSRGLAVRRTPPRRVSVPIRPVRPTAAAAVVDGELADAPIAGPVAETPVA